MKVKNTRFMDNLLLMVQKYEDFLKWQNNKAKASAYLTLLSILSNC